MTDQTDTHVPPARFPPPSRLDQVKGMIGDLARPFAIYAASLAAAIAVVIVAQKVTSGDGAVFIGAVFFGLGVLYGAKSYENAQASKHDAQVQIAQAAGPSLPVS